ncbi:MAG: alkaline phosphatase family protein [Chloroflexi bacterium]|nr:alkaline phosphatase family protein [Chloroflexota bacterium]
MRGIRLKIILMLILSISLASCRRTKTEQPQLITPHLVVSPFPKESFHRRVGPGALFLVLDGAGSEALKAYLNATTMPHLSHLVEKGARAEALLGVDPTATLPTYAALSSGAFPAKTGLVADRAHLPGTELSPAGASAPPSEVEPLWRTAMRNGLRAAVLFWPDADPDVSEQVADYIVGTGEIYVDSALHAITLTASADWEGMPVSYSPPLEGTIHLLSAEGAQVSTLYLLLLDSIDDGQENYDRFLIKRERVVEPSDVLLETSKWAKVSVSPQLQSGAYFKITHLQDSECTLYQSPVGYNRAQPVELLREINDVFGFPPPTPDERAHRLGWISDEDYLYMASLQSRWMSEVAAHVWTKYQPDLLVTAQPIIGLCARRFLLVDPAQPGYTVEKASIYQSYMLQAYQIADTALGKLLETTNASETAIFVLSGHGVAPVHTTVNLSAVLSRDGLLAITKDGLVNANKTKAVAVSSGAAAHIYLNLVDRESSGTVEVDQYAAVQESVIAALRNTLDEDGAAPFARILRRSELADLGLDAEYSGDVFVQAAVGYTLSDDLSAQAIFEPAGTYGEWGYAADEQDMQGVFLAAGYGIRPGIVETVRLVDVAPTVARILGFSMAPDITDGRSIEAILHVGPQE